MTPAETLWQELNEARDNARLAGRPYARRESVEVMTSFLGRFEADLRAKWEAQKKERRKQGIDERAAAILNVYPRREGGEAALLSISKAIAKDGFDCVLERTAEYGQAVARWAPNRRKAQSGASLIPLPTTFFNQRRYMDDSSQWWEGTGGKKKVEKPISLPEPEGWRFAFPESRYVLSNDPWERIDLDTQKWIVAEMTRKKNSA